MSEVQGIWNKGKICVRLDTSKSHGCDNSMWANKGVENFGKLINFEYNGEIKTLIEWSKQYNLNYNGVRQRYFKGKNYTSEEILFGKQITNMKRNITDIKKLEKQKQRDKVSKMLSAYRLKDKKKGLQTDIDFEWTFNIISNSKCIYCENTENIGLDRIDNLKGHTKNNVVPCCYICNTTRNNNFSFEEMKIMGKIIKEIHLCRLKNLNY